MKLIILGAPGSGKGTAATVIREKYSLAHISTGDLFRYNIKEQTKLGIEAKSYIDRGALVPDDVTIRMVADRLGNDDCKSGYILDGFPRTIAQAEALNVLFSELGYNNVRVLNLTADDGELLSRLLKRGRSDDTEETIKHRLEVYYSSTAPVKGIYDKMNVVTDVNGLGSKEDINKKILEILE